MNLTPCHKKKEFPQGTRKDRNEKTAIRCSVSLLEPENELYNSGIVDVSHR